MVFGRPSDAFSPKPSVYCKRSKVTDSRSMNPSCLQESQYCLLKALHFGGTGVVKLFRNRPASFQGSLIDSPGA